VKKSYDVIIIGGGVVGCMVARFLSRYNLQILLIEKEADIGTGSSSANSAIVHAGYDPVPGSLKAIMNVAANAMWDTLSGELNIPFNRRRRPCQPQYGPGLNSVNRLAKYLS
jgi:glycerol-3-phosphate dehydrogenase